MAVPVRHGGVRLSKQHRAGRLAFFPEHLDASSELFIYPTTRACPYLKNADITVEMNTQRGGRNDD